MKARSLSFTEMENLDDPTVFPRGEHDATFAWYQNQITTNGIPRLLLRFDYPENPDRSAWLAFYEQLKGGGRGLKYVGTGIKLMADICGVDCPDNIKTLDQGEIYLQKVFEANYTFRIRTFQHWISQNDVVRTDVTGFVTKPI